MPGNFQITESKNGYKTVNVKGSFGLENYREFQAKVLDLINEENKKIILDFNNLQIIDSLGIGTLIMIAKIMKKKGREYVIINCREQIYLLLEPINLKNLVKIFRKSETDTDYFTAG